MSDERIRKAAAELSAALTEGGKDGRRYEVELGSVDVTALEDNWPNISYRVIVREVTNREIS